MSKDVLTILQSGSLSQRKALFVFDSSNTVEEIRLKFNLWSRFFFPQYFESPDKDFHKEMDIGLIELYMGILEYFLNGAFRGAAKTSRGKLFMAFAIANDKENRRRYIKVISEDMDNSKQIVTDIYNMLVSTRMVEMYPEIFQKSDSKREETMSSFTTSTKVKITAGTVNKGQRGALQENARPDFIWYEDFENRKTLFSMRVTKKIWDNMEEARTGRSDDGVCFYTFNYISESGNVHRLVETYAQLDRCRFINTAITVDGTALGAPIWPERYDRAAIDMMIKTDEDFEGERLGKPSASKDVFFDRETLDHMPRISPKREIAGFRIFKPYKPKHFYASGHDVAGGVGLDHSTSVFIDFSTTPAEVVATYKNNEIAPDDFGYEIRNQVDKYGDNLCAIEKNNHGHATIAIAKQEDVFLYMTEGRETRADRDVQMRKEYGWHTNGLTKPKMLFALKSAVENGYLLLNDEHLIAELSKYTRHHMMDKEDDPRLVTNHFDLLMACAIAWQMKDEEGTFREKEDSVDAEMQALKRRNANQSSIAR